MASAHLRYALISAVFCLGAVANAVDRHVPGDFPTIQAAIDASDTNDRVLVDDGVYSGAGNTNLDFGGVALTVMSVNGPDVCTLDGSASPGAHAFLLVSGEQFPARIEGFTISGFSTALGDEGAIRCKDSTPDIANCVFTGCSTASAPYATSPGSAIKIIHANVEISDCLFVSNQGSAVHTDADSAGFLLDCVFEDNVCRSSYGKGGGAVLNEGFTITFDSFYRRNKVEAISGPARGGAISNFGGSLDLTSATFEDNEVTGPDDLFGAAVYANAVFVMNHNDVLNHAGDHAGGAVYVDGIYAAEDFIPLIFADCTDNEVGAIRVDDPDGRLEVRIGSSEFCGNEHFDIQGPYVDWSANSLCCPGDVDGDSGVGVLDLIEVLSNWGECDGCPADLDGDGFVTVIDLLEVLSAWGSCPELPESI